MSQIVGSHLIVDMRAVSFNRLDADIQLETDLAAGETLHNQVENFAFSSGDAIDVAFDVVEVFADKIPVDVVIHRVGACDQLNERLDLNRLRQEINDAGLHRFHSRRCFSMTGDQGDHQITLVGGEFLLKL